MFFLSSRYINQAIHCILTRLKFGVAESYFLKLFINQLIFIFLIILNRSCELNSGMQATIMKWDHFKLKIRGAVHKFGLQMELKTIF